MHGITFYEGYTVSCYLFILQFILFSGTISNQYNGTKLYQLKKQNKNLEGLYFHASIIFL